MRRIGRMRHLWLMGRVGQMFDGKLLTKAGCRLRSVRLKKLARHEQLGVK